MLVGTARFTSFFGACIVVNNLHLFDVKLSEFDLCFMYLMGESNRYHILVKIIQHTTAISIRTLNKTVLYLTDIVSYRIFALFMVMVE